jgi:hypothetical protein
MTCKCGGTMEVQGDKLVCSKCGLIRSFPKRKLTYDELVKMLKDKDLIIEKLEAQIAELSRNNKYLREVFVKES